jgi:hypothetical protein
MSSVQESPTQQLPGVELSREKTRERLAYLAISGLIAVIAIIIVGGWFVRNEKVEDVLHVMAAATSILAGIVGAVVAFYFKSE